MNEIYKNVLPIFCDKNHHKNEDYFTNIFVVEWLIQLQFELQI